MKSTDKLKRQAQSRTPDQWYFNQYENERLAASLGFPTKELADSFMNSVDDIIKSQVKYGMKLREGVTHRVEKAVAWRVRGEIFQSFSDALYYMWTEATGSGIEGVFELP